MLILSCSHYKDSIVIDPWDEQAWNEQLDTFFAKHNYFT